MSASLTNIHTAALIVTMRDGRRRDVTGYCRRRLGGDDELGQEWWLGYLEAQAAGLTEITANQVAANHVYAAAGFVHRSTGKNPRSMEEYARRVIRSAAQSIGSDPGERIRQSADDEVGALLARIMPDPDEDQAREIIRYIIEHGAGPAELARQQAAEVEPFQQLDLFTVRRTVGRRWPGAPTSESGWSRWISRQIATIWARLDGDGGLQS